MSPRVGVRQNVALIIATARYAPDGPQAIEDAADAILELVNERDVLLAKCASFLRRAVFDKLEHERVAVDLYLQIEGFECLTS